MKKLLKFISLSFIFCLLVSCTNYENFGATVSFTFNGADFYKDSGARDVPVGNPGFYLVASLMGDYSDTKVIPVSEAVGNQTVEFTSVPVGAEVSVMAYVYTHIDYPMEYYGKSEVKKIFSGSNPVKLVMESLPAGFYSESETLVSSYILVEMSHNNISCSFDSESGIGGLQICFYTNGVYLISCFGGDIISKGFYTLINDNIYLTECVYSPVTYYYHPGNEDTDNQPSYSVMPDYKDIIVTSPKVQVFKNPLTEFDSDIKPYFKSGNGIVYILEHSA